MANEEKKQYFAKYTAAVLKFQRRLDADELYLPATAFERGYIKQGDSLYKIERTSIQDFFTAKNSEDAKEIAKSRRNEEAHSQFVKTISLDALFEIKSIPLS